MELLTQMPKINLSSTQELSQSLSVFVATNLTDLKTAMNENRVTQTRFRNWLLELALPKLQNGLTTSDVIQSGKENIGPIGISINPRNAVSAAVEKYSSHEDLEGQNTKTIYVGLLAIGLVQAEKVLGGN